MTKTNFSGTGVALITPFKSDYNIDENALVGLVNHLIEGGVDYLVALGTTAETATLTSDEKRLVLDIVTSTAKGKCKIVIGAGGNNTSEVISSIKHVSTYHPDGILSVAPYYNKPNQRGMFEHFAEIAKSTPLPIILYNVPGRTSSNLLPSTILKLNSEFSNIVAVKEASGNINQIMEIIESKSSEFQVLSGDDALTLPILSVGGQGVISVVANAYPKEFSTMINLCLSKNFAEALPIHYNLLSITNALFQDGNPAGIKALLHTKGICENYLRLPLVPVESSLYNKIFELNQLI